MRLQQQFKTSIRLANYAYSTEKAYWFWIRSFLFFHGMKHPDQLTADDISQFLTHLILKKHVSVSTQKQALSALVFLYRNVLNWEDIKITDWCQSKRPKKLPAVFSRSEAESVMTHLTGTPLLVTLLMYGAGLRLIETLRLRVKDIDFHRNEITVREGKGNKDRVTVLPQKAIAALQSHINHSSLLHSKALKEGVCYVYLPNALGRKYPNAGKELA